MFRRCKDKFRELKETVRRTSGSDSIYNVCANPKCRNKIKLSARFCGRCGAVCRKNHDVVRRLRIIQTALKEKAYGELYRAKLPEHGYFGSPDSLLVKAIEDSPSRKMAERVLKNSIDTFGDLTHRFVSQYYATEEQKNTALEKLAVKNRYETIVYYAVAGEFVSDEEILRDANNYREISFTTREGSIRRELARVFFVGRYGRLELSNLGFSILDSLSYLLIFGEEHAKLISARKMSRELFTELVERQYHLSKSADAFLSSLREAYKELRATEKYYDPTWQPIRPHYLVRELTEKEWEQEKKIILAVK